MALYELAIAIHGLATVCSPLMYSMCLKLSKCADLIDNLCCCKVTMQPSTCVSEQLFAMESTVCIHVKSAKFLTSKAPALISLQLSCIIGFIPYTHFINLKHHTCHILFTTYNVRIHTYVRICE